jgi:tetratricopeptide (TPR) repeat protein
LASASPGAAESATSRRIFNWLRSPAAGGALWVYGEPGSGRTTAVAAALECPGSGSFHVKRVACWRGSPLEEVLEDIAAFLQQLGSDALASTLSQRSFTTAKVGVLLQCLEAARVVLWLDDVDELLVAPGEGGWPQGEAIAALLRGCAALGGRAGRVILVSRPVELPGADRIERSEAAAVAPRSAGELEAAIAGLSEPARKVLEALTFLAPEPSRQAVRAGAEARAVELGLQAAAPDPAVTELARADLIRLPPGEGSGGACLALPWAVRRQAQEALHRAGDASIVPALQAALGAYFLRLAAASSSPWHLLHGWRAFQQAGLVEQAYATQKLFLQTLIQRGSHPLARHVLQETVRQTEGPNRAVALGNLAILHKTAGELDEALKLYEQVRDEFARAGDGANVARVLHQIGNTRFLRGETQLALESYESSLSLSAEAGDNAVATATRIQIANIFLQQGDRDRALASYTAVLGEARAVSNQVLAAAITLQVAQIHLQEKRYLEAEVHLRAAEQHARSSGDLRSLLKTLDAQGKVARERRDYDAARGRFDDACRVAEALGDDLEAAAALLAAGEVERSRLQLADALRCYDRAAKHVESHLSTGDARGSETALELAGLVAGRRRELEESVGPEVFARLVAATRT